MLSTAPVRDAVVCRTPEDMYRGPRPKRAGRVRKMIHCLRHYFGDDLAKVMWFSAAENGSLEVIQTRIAIGYPHIDVRGKWGRTALWSASANGHLHIVEALLDAGADPGAGDLGLDSFRPLHIAVYHGWVDIVRALLEAGADAGAPDWFERTPWDLIAVSRGPLEVKREMDALITAAGGGRIALGLPLIEGRDPCEAEGLAAVPRYMPEGEEDIPYDPSPRLLDYHHHEEGEEEGTSDGGGVLVPTCIPEEEILSEETPRTPGGGTTPLLMTAPPGATAGTRLRVRTYDARAFEVTVPHQLDEGGNFVIHASPAAAQAAIEAREHSTEMTPRSPEGSEAASAPATPPSPTYGRPVGTKLPTLDTLASEVVELKVGKATPIALDAIDDITTWLAAPPLTLQLKRARACAVALVAEHGVTETRDLMDLDPEVLAKSSKEVLRTLAPCLREAAWAPSPRDYDYSA